jgi:hypothetical protein
MYLTNLGQYFPAFSTGIFKKQNYHYPPVFFTNKKTLRTTRSTQANSESSSELHKTLVVVYKAI